MADDSLEGAVDILGHETARAKNWNVFLLNFHREIRFFDSLLAEFHSTWSRLGVEKDAEGRFHAGLLGLVNILTRHTIFGFHSLACYQSYLTWLNFRPGLEALLFLGRWVDNPSVARVWQERETDPKAYKQAFATGALKSLSLPRSADFLRVLGHLNDDYMHPNPGFTYRHATARNLGSTIALEIYYFDPEPDVHEANLLAYLNLMDTILASCKELVASILGPPKQEAPVRPHFAKMAAVRANELAEKDPVGRKAMVELGLWNL